MKHRHAHVHISSQEDDSDWHDDATQCARRPAPVSRPHGKPRKPRVELRMPHARGSPRPRACPPRLRCLRFLQFPPCYPPSPAARW
jgi:hypothetical protein